MGGLNSCNLASGPVPQKITSNVDDGHTNPLTLQEAAALATKLRWPRIRTQGRRAADAAPGGAGGVRGQAATVNSPSEAEEQESSRTAALVSQRGPQEPGRAALGRDRAKPVPSRRRPRPQSQPRDPTQGPGVRRRGAGLFSARAGGPVHPAPGRNTTPSACGKPIRLLSAPRRKGRRKKRFEEAAKGKWNTAELEGGDPAAAFGTRRARRAGSFHPFARLETVHGHLESVCEHWLPVVLDQWSMFGLPRRASLKTRGYSFCPARSGSCTKWPPKPYGSSKRPSPWN